MNCQVLSLISLATLSYRRLFCVVQGLGICLGLLLLAGCSPDNGAAQRPGAVFREETVTLPTRAPTVKPSPASTRVMPVEVLTPPLTPSLTPLPQEARGLVVDVIDGDTVSVVMDGDSIHQSYRVRYLGIDAPENISGNPWGIVAYETNRRLVNLRVVRLVRDRTDIAEDGSLLRYVYVGNQLLSIVLAEEGLARADNVPPDTRFRAAIAAAEARAKASGLGVWSGQLPTPTVTPGAPPAALPAEATATSILTTAPITLTVVPAATITSTVSSPAATIIATGTSGPLSQPVVTATVEAASYPSPSPAAQDTPDSDLIGP